MRRPQTKTRDFAAHRRDSREMSHVVVCDPRNIYCSEIRVARREKDWRSATISKCRTMTRKIVSRRAGNQSELRGANPGRDNDLDLSAQNRMPDGTPTYKSRQWRADKRLESWKEIAAYLGREVRTIQRWEKSDGLPIHRLYHAKRGTVYAFTQELDQWWESRRNILTETSGEPALQEPAAEDLAAQEPAAAQSAPAPALEEETPKPETAPRRPPLRRLAIPAIGISIVLAVVAGWILRAGFALRSAEADTSY